MSIQEAKDAVNKRVVKPVLDGIINKVVSKKLIVFTVACAALFSGALESGDWTFIACLYMFGLIYLNHIDKKSI